MDEVDLKVKELLGINPYPNKCPWCSSQRRIAKFEINTIDGNVHCSECHKQIKLGRIDNKCFRDTKNCKTYRMNTLRRRQNK